MKHSDFSSLLALCKEFAQTYPTGLVFIGGIAVYLHAINSPATSAYAELTHDADFYISMADMSELRSYEEVSANRRLNKHQLIKRGFEFDIYTERQSNLLVPFDEISAHATGYDGVRVAAFEHLLVLKLEAYRDRRTSSKGEKDARDIAQLAITSQHQQSFNAKLCAPYLADVHVELLQGVQRSPEIVAMAKGNAVVAKRIRRSLEEISKEIERLS